MQKKLSRRDFIRASGVAAGAGLLAACATPATTAMTRSSPLASSEIGVTCTTNIAVSGASSGSVPGKNRDATR